MEYKLNTTNYRDFKVIEDNKLAGRAYFIPYSKKEKLCAVDLRHERTDSDLVEVLSGEWDFKYYNDISTAPTSSTCPTRMYPSICPPESTARLLKLQIPTMFIF